MGLYEPRPDFEVTPLMRKQGGFIFGWLAKRKQQKRDKGARDTMQKAQVAAGDRSASFAKEADGWWKDFEQRVYHSYQPARTMGNRAMRAIDAGLTAGDFTPKELQHAKTTGAKMPSWNRGRGGRRLDPPKTATSVGGMENRYNPGGAALPGDSAPQAGPPPAPPAPPAPPPRNRPPPEQFRGY